MNPMKIIGYILAGVFTVSPVLPPAHAAAPLSYENSFTYPNPGPASDGNIYFQYNMHAASGMSVQIFDSGFCLIEDTVLSGIAGSNIVAWDRAATNKANRLETGVYVYKMRLLPPYPTFHAGSDTVYTFSDSFAVVQANSSKYIDSGVGNLREATSAGAMTGSKFRLADTGWSWATKCTGQAFAFVRKGNANPVAQSAFGADTDRSALHLVIYPKGSGVVSSIKVTTAGTGDDATGVSAIRLWHDTDGNGRGDILLGRGRPTTDNGTVMFGGLLLPLTKDKPTYFVVTTTYTGTASAGQTFYTSISSTSDITGVVNGQAYRFEGLPISGEPLTILTSANTDPDTPSVSSPADGATGVATTGELTLTGFTDSNGDSHKCTHWQVTDSTTIFDNMHMKVNRIVGSETAGLRFKFPRGLLKGAEKHYWRGRLCDARGGWSGWSTARSFTTAAETFTITPTTTKSETNPHAPDPRPVGFKVKDAGNERLTMLGGEKFESAVDDTGQKVKSTANFKFGLFVFTFEGVAIGGTVTITFNMPEAVPTTAKYFIYDPSGGWIDMTSALSGHDGDSEIHLTLTDGGTGDLDGLANGIVSDPGGFEVDASSSSVKYPSACIVGRLLPERPCKILRSIRDKMLDCSFGRAAVGLYYGQHPHL